MLAIANSIYDYASGSLSSAKLSCHAFKKAICTHEKNVKGEGERFFPFTFHPSPLT
jgi:hypothetical protein